MGLPKWDEVASKMSLIGAWARDGLTEKQIAHNLGIAMSTFSRFKLQHEELRDALKKNKEVADKEVENALYKRACGYSYIEATEERVPIRNDDGKVIGHEMKLTKKVKKDVAPDVTAQIFWLKNRMPEAWRDKKDFEHTGRVVMFEGEDLDE